MEKEESLKVELALVGVVPAAFVGFLVGALLEHPLGAGGYQVILAMMGALVALTILILGEAMKGHMEKLRCTLAEKTRNRWHCLYSVAELREG
jgi:hypothetical protein